MQSSYIRTKWSEKAEEPPVGIRTIPANQGYIDIEWKSEKAATLRGKLIGINGAKIMPNTESGKFELSVDPGTHVYRIHTRSAAPGLYQLQLYLGDELTYNRNVIIE